MNHYKTSSYKRKFTLDQVQTLINHASEVKTLHSKSNAEITFGSNKGLSIQLRDAGFIPGFLLQNVNENLYTGVTNIYGFPVYPKTKGFVMGTGGEYLYDKYAPDDVEFDPPLEPMYFAIDHSRKEFMLQYPYGICVFGDESGTVTYVRMD